MDNLRARPAVWFVVGGAVAVTGLVVVANAINVLVTVLLAIILAEAIRPAVLAMEQRGVPRAISIGAIYLAILVVAAGSVALLLPPLTSQVQGIVRAAPEYAARLQEIHPSLAELQIDPNPAHALSSGLRGVDALPILRGALAIPVSLASAIIAIVSGLVLAAYWIGFTESIGPVLASRLSAEREQQVRAMAGELSRVWGGWLRGQLVLMLFVGILAFVGLAVLGVPYPVALAVFAGVTEILPIIGPWIGALPAVLLSVVQTPGLAIAVVVLYFVIQQIENHLLVPKVMQRAVGLHPFVVLLALLIGGALLGLPGVIIAVPVASGIQAVASVLLGPAPPTAEPPAAEEQLAEA